MDTQKFCKFPANLGLMVILYFSLLLEHCFAELRSAKVATVYCSSQTTPQHIIQKLTQGKVRELI